MKKKISMLLIMAMLATSLTACGKFTCDWCGEEKSGKSHTTTALGEKMEICDDCYKEMKSMFE
jgi:hypothetical protein